jgi:hypothetical protein
MSIVFIFLHFLKKKRCGTDSKLSIFVSLYRIRTEICNNNKNNRFHLRAQTLLGQKRVYVINGAKITVYSNK